MVFSMQICLLVLAWNHQLFVDDGLFTHHESLNTEYVRFIASMLMHLNVCKDVTNGLLMMKYAVNHFENFTNVHIAFFVAFMHTIISLGIEVTVIMVLCSFSNVLQVIMGYVSLSAIANIPKFFYGALHEHKMLKCAGHKLDITNYRHNNLTQHAPCHVKFMRFIQKSLRIFFVSFTYYFMPYVALLISFLTLEADKIKKVTNGSDVGQMGKK